MKTITKNLLESLEETQTPQVSGTLMDLIRMNHNELDSDVFDTDIDMAVALVYQPEMEESTDSYDRFITDLCKITQVDRVGRNGIVCKFSDALKPFNEQWKDIFEMGYSEFDEDEAYYEAVANLEALISGNASDRLYGELCDILEGKKTMNESADALDRSNGVPEIAYDIEEKISDDLDDYNFISRDDFENLVFNYYCELSGEPANEETMDKVFGSDLLTDVRGIIGYDGWATDYSEGDLSTLFFDDEGTIKDEDEVIKFPGVNVKLTESAKKSDDIIVGFKPTDQKSNLKSLGLVGRVDIKCNDGEVRSVDLMCMDGEYGISAGFSPDENLVDTVNEYGMKKLINDIIAKYNIKLTESAEGNSESIVTGFRPSGQTSGFMGTVWIKCNDGEIRTADFVYTDGEKKLVDGFYPNQNLVDTVMAYGMDKIIDEIIKRYNIKLEDTLEESAEDVSKFWASDVKVGDKLPTSIGEVEILALDKAKDYIVVKRKGEFVAAWAPELDSEGKLSWGQGHYFNEEKDAMEYLEGLKESFKSSSKKSLTESDDSESAPEDIKEVLDLCSELGWGTYISKQSDDWYVELEQWDSSGGDHIIAVNCTDADSLIEALAEYADAFDPEEEFGIYYDAGNNGLSGVPGPRDLMDAMEEREKMNNDLVEELEKKFKGRKSIGEIVGDEPIEEAIEDFTLEDVAKGRHSDEIKAEEEL